MNRTCLGNVSSSKSWAREVGHENPPGLQTLSYFTLPKLGSGLKVSFMFKPRTLNLQSQSPVVTGPDVPAEPGGRSGTVALSGSAEGEGWGWGGGRGRCFRAQRATALQSTASRFELVGVAQNRLCWNLKTISGC